MKKTVAILSACVTLALIGALRLDNSSGTAVTPKDLTSSTLVRGSSHWHTSSRASRSGRETTLPASDDSLSVPEESQRQPMEEPPETATEPTETFWAFVSEEEAMSNTEEPSLTLDQFDRPYAMTMTEAGFAQLSPADKSLAIDETVDSLRQARRDAWDTYAQADADIAQGNYARAEMALLSETERLGEFNANEEGLYLTRIIGISFQQTALKKLERLYTRTGDHARRQTTQQQWQDLEARKHQMQAAQMEQAG